MTTPRWTLAVLLTSMALACGTSAGETVVATAGRTDFRIVLPAGADTSTTAVALDLAAVLKDSTGALFPVYMDDFDRPSDHEILIGADNARLKQIGLADLTREFAPDEYAILTRGKYIIIAGAPPRGTINGIYGFLQDHLGCRWLTPGCQYIPSHRTLTLGDLNDRQKPAFHWRSLNGAMSWDPAWYARNRLNESKEECGGPRPSSIMQFRSDPRVASMANSWSPHAFEEIPESLYQEHPEWYAQKGTEHPFVKDPVARAYCVTNDDFARWVADWTRQRIRRSPRPIKFISITASDNDNSCQCPRCQESNRKVGVSGTYMEFANKVGQEVEKEFPDVEIIMLAYAHTFEPNPVKLRPNVRIVWCPIGADYAHALDEGEVNGPGHHDYAAQLGKWIANTQHLGVWYYQDSIDAPMPRPTFAAMQRSFRLLRDRKVDQVTIEMTFNVSCKNTADSDGDKTMPAYAAVEDYYSRQGNYASWMFPYGFEHLRGYIQARLLWDPDFDWRKGIGEFCDIYYGPAGKDVAEYALAAEDLGSYDKSYAFPEAAGIHMRIDHGPRMKLAVLEQCQAAFDRAAAKVKENSLYLRRVQMARLSPDLALLVTAPPGHPMRQQAFDRFFSLAEQIGIASSFNTPGGGGSVADLKKTLGQPDYKPQ